MRYLLLILLNLPIIILAFTNTLTQYKLGSITKSRFRHQAILWMVILIILLVSFPVYNYINSSPLFDAGSLSLFDIVEITVLIYLIYIVNNQRRKIEQNEKDFRRLHQEISIKLSMRDGKN